MLLTHSEDKVVEGLLVDGLKCSHQLKGKVHQEGQVSPPHLDGVVLLRNIVIMSRVLQLSKSTNYL